MSERGSALVEFALVLPMFLLLATGMASFGIALNNYLELTNAVAIGAQQLAVNRSNTTNPCQLAAQVVSNAAPFLSQKSIDFTYVLDGVSYGPYSGVTASTCSSTSTSTGAAGDLVEQEPAEVMATYPCTLAVYGANIIPGCTMHAQVTEIVQ
ncbi:MAG TPA: TadE family protein [Acidobacteriaceae bacterium]|nr:TadE family protein [Acidobacteriaceae bacterium]